MGPNLASEEIRFTTDDIANSEFGKGLTASDSRAALTVAALKGPLRYQYGCLTHTKNNTSVKMLLPRSATQAALKKKLATSDCVVFSKEELVEEDNNSEETLPILFLDSDLESLAAIELAPVECGVAVFSEVRSTPSATSAVTNTIAIPTNPDNFEVNAMDDETARIQRCRERNREHARRTRLRKKVALHELQTKITQLQATMASLQQRQQDQSIASILLGLNNKSPCQKIEDGPYSAETTRMETPVTDHVINEEFGDRRKCFVTSQKQLNVRIAGKGVVTIQSQVNWKTGTYIDEQGLTQKLTLDELELLR